MPTRKPPRGATRRARQADSRRQTQVSFDRWLDRLVEIAVFTALLVGGMALVVTFF